jgi:hypothetical protein
VRTNSLRHKSHVQAKLFLVLLNPVTQASGWVFARPGQVFARPIAIKEKQIQAFTESANVHADAHLISAS